MHHTTYAHTSFRRYPRRRPIRHVPALLLILLLFHVPHGLAQEQSVRPGINDSFRDPDPKQFTERFEIESREVFAHRKEIVDAVKLKPTDVVADIGAGTGLFTRLFAAQLTPHGRVVAVDIAQNFLDHIQRTCREQNLPNVDVLLCTPDSTALPAESIDVAFVCDTYHHFEFPQKTLSSIRNALKPGGRLVLIDFKRIEGKSSEWTLSHVRAGQEVFEAEVCQAGFRKVNESTGLLQENYMVFFEVDQPRPAIVAGAGNAISIPDATEPPRAGIKAVLDVTAASKSPDQVNPGLDRAARLLNLYGIAGLQASDVTITIVLHGNATSAVMTDQAWNGHFRVPANPNLPLIQSLQQLGVKVAVCGQSLHSHNIAREQVAPGIPVAWSAMTLILNHQSDGHAYLPVH